MNKIKHLLIFGIFILIFLAPSIMAHPHPIYFIKADSSHINIHAFHPQRITEQYMHENFILEDCDYYNFEQDESKLNYLETVIVLEHNCSNLTIQKNTLFKDYWGKIPLTVYIKGFNEKQNNGYDNSLRSQGDSLFQKGFAAISQIQLTGNFFMDIFIIFLLGFILSIFGDLFSFIIPISIGSRASGNKNFLYYSIFIHLISTYIFIYFSLLFFSSFLSKYVWIIIILVGALMLLENYFKRRNISPYLIAAIPCPATIFIVTIFLEGRLILSFIAPILVIGAEFILLLLLKKIKIPKKYYKAMPYVFFVIGILLFVKLLVVSVPVSEAANPECEWGNATINEYFLNLETQLRISSSCQEVLDYMNSHECTDHASYSVEDERYVFKANWDGGKKIFYSYEVEGLPNLD